MASSKQPSISAETSSGEGPPDDEQSTRGETKWKRFHPFRVVRKIFRRRVKRQGTAEVQDTSKKSWSTSELQCVQDETTSKYEVPTPPYKLGLSVSHDSIFSPDNGSNSINPEELNRPQGSSLSVQHAGIKNMFKDELFSRVRARRDSDDDDVGLPHSPCTSPTTVDVLTQGLKEKSSKSQTTCSAGSLISMGSSENDDDSAGQLSSGHSSRMSLLDRRSVDSEGDADLCQSVPLNHKAAHHKIAVRPKRTHGLPQRRLKQLAASAISTLPSTPEVIEDNGRSGRSFTKMETFQMIETSSVTMTSTDISSTTSQLEEISIKQCDVAVSEETSSSTAFARQMLHVKQTNSETFSESRSETWHAGRNFFTNQDESESSDLEPMKPVSREGSYSGLSDISSDTSIKEKRSSFTRSDEEKFTSFVEKAGYSPDGVLFKSDKIVSDNISHTEPDTRSDSEETEQNQGPDLVTLRVSAMVKTLEQSECSYTSEKVSSLRKSGTGSLLKTEIGGTTVLSENSCFVSETASTNECIIKQSDVNETYIEKVKNQLLYDGKNDLEPDIVSNTDLLPLPDMRSPAVENESSCNALESPVQTDQDVHRSETLETEKQHLYQKKTVEQTADLLSMRSSFHEEESIMSEKNVPVIEPKISSMNSDSKIFISHSVAESASEITEAHNLVTVDSSFVTNVRTLDSVSPVQNAEKTHGEEPWVSSVDIGPCVLPSPTSDMTVHSLVSQVTNKINAKDRITISVNSAVEEPEIITSSELPPAKGEVVSPATDHETPTTEIKTISEASPGVPDKILNIKPKTKDEPKKSPSMDKLPHKNVQKRVSVEIVPFSQRMKERKYQPVIYTKDTTVSEPMKSFSQTTVERKLSDRKSPSEQTAQQVKGNNRHSFPGLPTESTKVESLGEDKKTKADKIPRPVHIRIHKENTKSPSSVSEKSAEEKNNVQQSKLNKRVAKSFVKSGKEAENEEKPKSNTSVSGSAPPKWEVKIQPAANSAKANLSLSFSKEKTEDPVHTAVDNQELQDKLSDTNSDVDSYDLTGNLPYTASSSKDAESRGSTPSLTSESPPIKSRENSWRSGKDSFPPSDMEPELYRVFARRSIKQKNVDKSDDKQESTSGTCSSDDGAPCDTPEKSEGSNQIINISNNSTVIKISEKNDVVQEKSVDLSKKKSKSFNEKDKQTVKSYSSVQQTSLNRKQPQLPTETHPVQKDPVHRRQRLASVPDILPPPVDTTEPEKNQQNGTYSEEDVSVLNKTENLQRASSLSISTSANLSNGGSAASAVDILKAKENVDASSKDSSTPSWLQLAQQRRELREQRERLLLGSSTSSFVLESSSKPSRSSKVWDMVNSFQKMQMT